MLRRMRTEQCLCVTCAGLEVSLYLRRRLWAVTAGGLRWL